MSAPTPGLPNGQANVSSSTVPAGRPMIRRPRKADPMVPRKKPTVMRPIGHQRPPPSTLPSDAGLVSPATDLAKLREKYGGWSEPPPKEAFTDFPITITKRGLKDGIRFHALRFSGAASVDLMDQNEFTRPVTLHRRDAQQPPPGRAVPREEIPQPEPQVVDDKEAERLAQLKAERDAQKAIDQAKIAPVNREPRQKKQKKQKEDKISLSRMPKTQQGKKASDLRYTEALQWHMEDADGKNVWVGSYEQALSEANVALVVDGASFRMIPLEKWYKFTSKPNFVRYTPEQAEAHMKSQTGISRWMMKNTEKREEQQKALDDWRKVNGPVNRRREIRRPVNTDAITYDEVDMDPGDEFQDDDEHAGFDLDDEDVKMSNDRVRQNQLGANLFGDGDEQAVDEHELNERRKERVKKEEGKRLRSALKKEGENAIESDESDSNPFKESGSSDDESEEEEDQPQSKAEEEETAKAEGKDKTGATSLSRGNLTPSKVKQVDPLKKGKSLKRPGSPNFSESSGNESSRKKAKNKTTSSAQSRSSTPLAQTQPLGQSGQRRRIIAGSMSDGEATGGEMSDGPPKKKKIKLVANNGRGTPSGSRAGSPIPAVTAGSATASPVKDGQVRSRAGSPGGAVEAWEIIKALPPLPQGITIGNFLKLFADRVGDEPGKMPKSEWIKLVKQNCVYGNDKLLRRKT